VKRLDDQRAINPPHASRQNVVLNLQLLTLRGLQYATRTVLVSLFRLAECPSTCTHVQPIRVDEAIFSERRGIKFGAGDRVDVQHVHRVDLLQRTILGLDHEEVNDDEQREAAGAEDKTVEVVDLVRDQGREERDEEVEEPVAGGRQSHANGAVTGWVKFTDDSLERYVSTHHGLAFQVTLLTHTSGPHVVANAAMKRHVNTIMMLPA